MILAGRALTQGVSNTFFSSAACSPFQHWRHRLTSLRNGGFNFPTHQNKKRLEKTYPNLCSRPFQRPPLPSELKYLGWRFHATPRGTTLNHPPSTRPSDGFPCLLSRLHLALAEHQTHCQTTKGNRWKIGKIGRIAKTRPHAWIHRSYSSFHVFPAAKSHRKEQKALEMLGFVYWKSCKTLCNLSFFMCHVHSWKRSSKVWWCSCSTRAKTLPEVINASPVL